MATACFDTGWLLSKPKVEATTSKEHCEQKANALRAFKSRTGLILRGSRFWKPTCLAKASHEASGKCEITSLPTSSERAGAISAVFFHRYILLALSQYIVDILSAKTNFSLSVIADMFRRKGCKLMGYRVKIQKVERPSNRSFYLNFPMALAEALGVKKGETFEWEIEDRNTLIVKRIKPSKSTRKK